MKGGAISFHGFGFILGSEISETLLKVGELEERSLDSACCGRQARDDRRRKAALREGRGDGILHAQVARSGSQFRMQRVSCAVHN